MSRLRPVLAAALLAAAVAGCTPAAPAAQPANPERPYEGLAFDISQVPPELRVREPRDVRSLPICDGLTDAQLTQLGLRADTAEVRNLRLGSSCLWIWADDHLNYASAGYSANQPNPALPGLYTTRGNAVVFEAVQIAGHPGIRVVEPHGSCEVVVATSDDQLLGLTDNNAGRPMADPCARPLRMAELIIPTLPARR